MWRKPTQNSSRTSIEGSPGGHRSRTYRVGKQLSLSDRKHSAIANSPPFVLWTAPCPDGALPPQCLSHTQFYNPMQPRSARLALLGVTLCCLLLAAWGSLPLDVVELTGSNFEHQTQASTGQTTGVWCVLFLNRTASSQHQLAAEDAWAQLAADEEKNTLFAQVDVSAAAALVNRFSLSQLPAALLFRDRQMYRLPQPLDSDVQGLVHQVQDFLAGGFQEQEGQTVPPVASALDRPRAWLLALFTAGPTLALYTGVFFIVLGLGLFLGALAYIFWPDNASKPAAAAAAAADAKGSSSSSSAKPSKLKTRTVAGPNGERLEPVVESPLAKVSAGASPFATQGVQGQQEDRKKVQ